MNGISKKLSRRRPSGSVSRWEAYGVAQRRDRIDATTTSSATPSARTRPHLGTASRSEGWGAQRSDETLLTGDTAAKVTGDRGGEGAGRHGRPRRDRRRRTRRLPRRT